MLTVVLFAFRNVVANCNKLDIKVSWTQLVNSA